MRHYLLAAVVTLAVVLPRSLSVQQAHSESWDDQYHLSRGLYFLKGGNLDVAFNLPPLGEAILAVPLWLSGCTVEAPTKHPDYSQWNPIAQEGVLYGQELSPEVLLRRVAIWKSLLFLLGAMLVFHWCMKLYGVASGWLALAMLLVDPTMAAHTTPAATDMLAMFLVAAAAYAQWRWSEHPSIGRLTLASLATAAAILTHHLALALLPIAGILLFLNQWVRVARSERKVRAVWDRLLVGGVMTLLMIWVLTGFDISRPRDHCSALPASYTQEWNLVVDVINPNLERRWPAGIYIASLAEGTRNTLVLKGSWLLGRRSAGGVWYYFPVIAFYKVPIGIAVVLVAGFVSVLRRRVGWNELSLLVPLGVYVIFLTMTAVQPGFRYALSAYLLGMMFASRCLTLKGWGWQGMAWGGVIVAAVHSISWHPNYLTYINWPRERVWMQIGDSNLDWGQSLKQVRQWIDTHAAGRRDIYLGYEGNPTGFSPRHYLADRVIEVPSSGPLPSRGLLIISPMWLSGVRSETEVFAPLRSEDPIAIIGDCMLVFDLGSSPGPTTATNAP